MNNVPRFTRSEELANAISHFIGALLSITALVLMIIFSSKKGNAWHIVSTSVFGATLILLYFSSTFNHIVKEGKAKEFFFKLDQIAIFLLIAGTYTPLSLIVLHGTLGWTIFGIEWALALFGIVYNITNSNKFASGPKIINILLYIFMGWLVIIATVPLLNTIPLIGFIWILIGGLCYTLGVLFFKLSKFKYHHLVWHLFVLGGSISHFIAIFFYAIPLSI